MRIIPPGILIFAFCMNALGQGRTAEDLQAKAKQIKASKEIHVAYDKFKDQLVIMAVPHTMIDTGMGLFSGGAHVLGVGATVTAPGKVLTSTPENIAVLFSSYGSRFQFAKGDATLYVIADGERYVFPVQGGDADVYHGSAMEQLVYKVSRADFIKITNAKVIEIRLGDSRPQTLKPKIVEVFRSFLQVIDVGS